MKSSLSVLAAPMVFGCASPIESERSGPRLYSRPELPTVTPKIGLSDVDGTDARLYVPASYSPDLPAPLFIGLHGAGGSSTDWQSYHARADARGMIFLAPGSRADTWDLIAFGTFGPDVEYLDLALQHTFERCRIDPERIALGGFSDGASYALSLGVSNGDLFGHLVGYSPGFVASAPPTVGEPKIYVSHGRADGIIPVTVSRESTVPLLRDAGYEVTYEEFDGEHEVPAAISDSALDWFLDVGGAA